jgi:hypothetical protein
MNYAAVIHLTAQAISNFTELAYLKSNLFKSNLHDCSGETDKSKQDKPYWKNNNGTACYNTN